jgi:uncharacterized protein (TIGR02246 family)
VTRPDLSPSDRAALEGIVVRLQTAWNAMDGPGFAAVFAEDADFVNILGEHHRGKAAIAAGHEAIFRTVYAGSSYRSVLEAARLLAPDVALVHVHAVLDVPNGPMAGRHRARFSMALTRTSDGWEIAAFHNTREPG